MTKPPKPTYEQVIAIEAVLLQEYGHIPNPTNMINRLYTAVINPEEIVGPPQFINPLNPK